MKTNQNMIRKMGSFQVVQRTKDGMFNATELLSQWNDFAGTQKQMSHFTENASTKEYIQTIENDVDSKERNSVLIQSRGKNGGTWMHPYLFIDFAMWLNPKFKLQVIKFVYDELIKYRHSAGDNYKSLAASAQSLKHVDYTKIAKGLNYIVFGKHEENLRQFATKEQLKELSDLQRNLAFAIDNGLIKSFEGLMEFMRNMFANKYNVPIILRA